MNTLPQGITLSTSQVGKLRQHMSDCDSGEIVLEARGDMCDPDEPSGQQKPLKVGPVLAQVLVTFLSNLGGEMGTRKINPAQLEKPSEDLLMEDAAHCVHFN